jgi:transposase
LTERIEYANSLNVETLVTDETRLQSVTRILSFSLQFERFTMAESPFSPAFEADSPFVLSPGASPAVRPVRFAAARAKSAFPGSNSSKKARRKLELGSKPSIQDPDLQSTRAYKKELKQKLFASSITQDLSLRILLHYLALKEEHLESLQRNSKKLSNYGGKLIETIASTFSLSRETLQKILEDFDRGGDAYESEQRGNFNKKATRIPQTSTTLAVVREFVRDKRSRREHVTGRQVLDFLIEKKIVKVPKDNCGFFETKAFACAKRMTNRWLKKNGYRRGKRSDNIRLKEHVAIKREQYLLEFIGNREKPPEQRYREVYLDESYCHQHHNHNDQCVYNPDDKLDFQEKRAQNRGARYCFLAAIQGPNPRKEICVDPADQARLVPNSVMMFQPSTRKDSSGDYHKVFNGGNFIKWFKEQLLPNLGDTPCVIMMDNAAYHLVYSEHVPHPYKMKKAELIEYLLSKGQSTTDQDGRQLPVLLLRAKVKAYIEKNEVSAVIELAREKFHKILFTPPYHSDLQPIELLWARIKGNVARLYSNGRTIHELKAQLDAEFGKLPDKSASIQGMIEKTAAISKKFWDEIPQGDEDEEDPQDPDDESSASGSDSSDEEEAETVFFDGFEGAAAEV